jgi:hypothetical protein
VEVIATVSQDPSLNRGNRERAVVFGWPAGAGRFVFSGALDAWRERDRGDGFGQFWRAQIAAAAAASPRALTVSVAPGMAAPGSTVRVHARLRPTAFDLVAARVLTPEVTARVIAPSGAERHVRLWPTSQPGAFEGRLEAGVAGDYDVQVTTSNGASGNTVLRVRPGVATPELADTDLAAVARATGGVAVDATDLSPLLRHLRALPAERRLERAHPTRSIWWSAAFATLLCLEWAGRRRTGAA